ncbi:MAG: dipeptide/oligopeptide/nickel ABC transporter permease/ATP-binding protein [Coriobacteriaceae bacterium]|uniref:dipeptide/oligopeptide/nickel ABC transporter permease/ATP-binding protein n=1 Tax=Tractidigestivibacter sp. TaxID=2847320 RepID=UPI002A80E616|nr:dipeptide/oligopeptide/nickel ABC transporter permease/ATP-binding protein [Tractidigestivibacter sp.]MCI6273761.1 dipeptide/oligopeptide/nickel ABC transporter permease/ATP-binding protein [Coriobacteriaceae bacterium]MCI6845440.1 dipeptide/oligopeptide/nickel ABC transporter permease/ATP-binding protein [Coriobacteriaceae bacterium]MCI7438901.1 dipeptide/oligopeptide/nickel ABC transporter permease/ATP-binding protein [Coriobacteriaceae bacterium]MDY4534959.1 dipeptide/oligopeptide/nickel 
MVKVRENQADKLERAAARGSRLSGLKNMKLSSRVALVVLVFVALSAILAPVIAPHDPLEIFTARQAPVEGFLFGTDDKGRDILSRMLYGGQYSLIIGFGATLFALVLGTIVGAVAAVSRKVVSEVIMRILDVVMSIPGIALAAVLVSVLGNSVPAIVVSIGFMYTPQIARIVRANIVSEYGEDYVRAAIVSGARAPWILARHVLRNCIAPIMVFTVTLVADAIIFEASLTFIGAGIAEPTPTWGNILADARGGVLAGRWWQALFPGLAIMITCLALNILSEGLTDAMAAKPGAPVDADGSESRRADDILASDPVRAYEVQAASLERRLSALRDVELRRNDRHVPDFSVKPLLQVKNLSISFESHGSVHVVDDVSFDVLPGQCMALVGESGCGKSITTKVIMNLTDANETVTGEVLYKGRDLLKLSREEHRKLLGHELAMVYQDALSSLNPSMLISAQMKQLTSRGGTRSAEELLELVGLDPKRTLESYPHELSGGQRQRVLIAMALTRDPSLVICDEPTTALDVTIQKQVIKLLNDLQAKLGFAMIFVSHDLALVAEVASEITVMYAGQVVEQAPTKELVTNPIHEYTRGLLGSVLSIEEGAKDGSRLHQVPGSVPSPEDFPKGDRFSPRSSHPTLGLDVHPVIKELPGDAHHKFSELPDDYLKEHGLTPYLETLDPASASEVR